MADNATWEVEKVTEHNHVSLNSFLHFPETSRGKVAVNVNLGLGAGLI